MPSPLVSPPPYLAVPLWATRILTIAMPVWAAWQGRLTIFEVVWVYWVEGWLLIPFMLLRIGAARGPHDAPGAGAVAEYAAHGCEAPPVRTATAAERLRMMLALLILRGGLLLFYLLFIIVFLLLQVTQQDAVERGIDTIVFRNPWANGIWMAFLVQHTLDVIAYFFMNGAWRTATPRSASSIFDRNTILMHVMLVSVVMLHQFLFEGKAYAAKGEVAYVAMFGALRLVFDAAARRVIPRQQRAVPEVQAEPGG